MRNRYTFVVQSYDEDIAIPAMAAARAMEEIADRLKREPGHIAHRGMATFPEIIGELVPEGSALNLSASFDLGKEAGVGRCGSVMHAAYLTESGKAFFRLTDGDGTAPVFMKIILDMFGADLDSPGLTVSFSKTSQPDGDGRISKTCSRDTFLPGDYYIGFREDIPEQVAKFRKDAFLGREDSFTVNFGNGITEKTRNACRKRYGDVDRTIKYAMLMAQDEDLEGYVDIVPVVTETFDNLVESSSSNGDFDIRGYLPYVDFNQVEGYVDMVRKEAESFE